MRIFARMRSFLMTLDKIYILCLFYLNFWEKIWIPEAIIYKFQLLFYLQRNSNSMSTEDQLHPKTTKINAFKKKKKNTHMSQPYW